MSTFLKKTSEIFVTTGHRTTKHHRREVQPPPNLLLDCVYGANFLDHHGHTGGRTAYQTRGPRFRKHVWANIGWKAEWYPLYESQYPPSQANAPGEAAGTSSRSVHGQARPVDPVAGGKPSDQWRTDLISFRPDLKDSTVSLRLLERVWYWTNDVADVPPSERDSAGTPWAELEASVTARSSKSATLRKLKRKPGTIRKSVTGRDIARKEVATSASIVSVGKDGCNASIGIPLSPQAELCV